MLEQRPTGFLDDEIGDRFVTSQINGRDCDCTKGPRAWFLKLVRLPACLVDYQVLACVLERS